MTLALSVPDFSIIVLLTEQQRDLAEALNGALGKLRSYVWNINEPEKAAADIRTLMEIYEPLLVTIPHFHAKAVRSVAYIAKKAGAESLLISASPERNEIDGSKEYLATYSASKEDLAAAQIVRTRMPSDLRHDRGPFDIVGDIHGCATELWMLLEQLGHAAHFAEGYRLIHHTEGRKVILVGDLTDRGPRNLDALRIAHDLHQKFGAVVVRGNHDDKLMRWLEGRDVRVAAGLALTIEELRQTTQSERDALGAWLRTLTTHHVLDEGKLVIAHAGLSEELQGRHTADAHSFAMYGKPTGDVTKRGTPIIHDWAEDYKGAARVVHGHVVFPEPRLVNNVLSIDTGCVFGGSLTAYRWPENDFASVPAQKAYFTYTAREVATYGHATEDGNICKEASDPCLEPTTR